MLSLIINNRTYWTGIKCWNQSSDSSLTKENTNDKAEGKGTCAVF